MTTNILPDRFRLDPVCLRPPILRDGSFRPICRYNNLINNELLLILNGKPTGYTLNFAVPENLAIREYDFDNSRRVYSETDIENINDIFALSEVNDMLFVVANQPSWAVYFQEANINKGLLLAFYLQRFNPNTLVSKYIIGRLQGWSILDIEANLFCFRNGQNIVELRELYANNMNYIVSIGNQRINEIQQSNGFQEYLKKIKLMHVEDISII